MLMTILCRCRIYGEENIPQQGGVIMVANHVNLLDSPILGVSLKRRLHFMAKEELFESRFIRWLVTQFGAFPVAKGKLDRRAGKTALDLLGKGEALFLYPEGKRSSDGRLGPAYSGAAMLSLRSGAPILPVGISGTAQLVGKWWWLSRPVIDIRIGKVFEVEAPAGIVDIRKHAQPVTRDIMLRIAALLPPEYHGRYAEEAVLETANY